MLLKKEYVDLGEKIAAGIRKAIQKLYEERAARNETVVISVNGEPRHVPAKDLLQKKS